MVLKESVGSVESDAMSTDPYPEVSGDESGIVPPQNSRTSEWPKKLRTLTAAELDRLTIDNSGRFYWDGKLVDYDTHAKPSADKSADSFDRSMDILDHASHELSGRRPAPIEGAITPHDGMRDESSSVELDLFKLEEAVTNAGVAPSYGTPGQRHLTLTRWQTAGAVVAVLGIVIGAFSMATYGYVAAREWGCKTGTFQNGCPAVPAPAARPDIPA